MAKARYYKVDGKKGKARDLPASLFDGVVNEDVMHQAVKVHLANQRQGTGSAKNRSAVRGGSRKPWRQKGTGRARQGSIRSVQWVGGGRAFPPIPHSWRQKLPKQVRLLARRSAWNVRADGDRVVLADLPSLDAPKTRDVRAFLEAIEAAEDKVLILTDGQNETLYLSARNMPKVKLMPFGEESVYDVLNADLLVIEKSALDDVPDEAPASGTKKVAPDAETATEEVEEEPEENASAEADEASDEDAGDDDVEASEDADDADAEDDDEEKTDG